MNNCIFASDLLMKKSEIICNPPHSRSEYAAATICSTSKGENSGFGTLKNLHERGKLNFLVLLSDNRNTSVP